MTNEELQKNSEHWYNKYKDAVERIEELEQENAELKEENLENESEAREINIRFDELLKKYMLQKSYLTKAKEIIKELLLLPYANNEEVYADVTSTLDKAEQFIKEIEK